MPVSLGRQAAHLIVIKNNLMKVSRFPAVLTIPPQLVPQTQPVMFRTAISSMFVCLPRKLSSLGEESCSRRFSGCREYLLNE